VAQPQHPILKGSSLGLIGYYSFVSVTLNVFEVPTPPGAKLLSETPER
jgi:hypothetical protein